LKQKVQETSRLEKFPAYRPIEIAFYALANTCSLLSNWDRCRRRGNWRAKKKN